MKIDVSVLLDDLAEMAKTERKRLGSHLQAAGSAFPDINGGDSGRETLELAHASHIRLGMLYRLITHVSGMAKMAAINGEAGA